MEKTISDRNWSFKWPIESNPLGYNSSQLEGAKWIGRLCSSRLGILHCFYDLTQLMLLSPKSRPKLIRKFVVIIVILQESFFPSVLHDDLKIFNFFGNKNNYSCVEISTNKFKDLKFKSPPPLSLFRDLKRYKNLHGYEHRICHKYAKQAFSVIAAFLKKEADYTQR